MPPKLQLLVASNRTLSLAFNNQAPLRQYKTDAQRLFIKGNIVESLALMLSLLNIGKNMDARQIEGTCQMVLDEPEFQILSPAEFREAFGRGVRGNYGKNYDSVDVQRVYGWLRSYIEERFEAVEQYREQEIGLLRANNNKPFMALAKFDLSLLIKKVAADDPRVDKHPHRERTPAELELDGYIADFEGLAASTTQTNAIKFVEYKGQHMDISTYCNARWEQARN